MYNAHVKPNLKKLNWCRFTKKITIKWRKDKVCFDNFHDFICSSCQDVRKLWLKHSFTTLKNDGVIMIKRIVRFDINNDFSKTISNKMIWKLSEQCVFIVTILYTVYMGPTMR